ncbi:MAG: gliding motility-associated C-terminal domain-containing protein, partial [Bacteroidia bacterium]
ISEPALLTASMGVPVNVSCNGGNNGSATVTIQGGTSPYTYSWNTNPVQTTATASGLSAGIYTVAITDINSCSATATVTISEPALLTASTDAPVNISCNGGNNGSATVTVQGGTSPYTYSWNTVPVQTDAIANNLKAGNYTVAVTDANSCLATATVTISEPALLTASMDAPINIRCNGGNNGSATVTVQGGTSPYIYSWNTTPVQTNDIATNLIAGNYTVNVTDANSCSATATVTISEPALLTATMGALVNVSCNGGNNGSATVIIQGGTSPYTYSWNTVPIQATAMASNLTAGNYIVTVIDANSCSATATVTISEPALLTASMDAPVSVSCNGGNNGSATVTIQGGTSPYTYSWNTIPVQNNATATNLIAGNYTVIVTDANNCSATATVAISEPALLTASMNAPVSVSCNGGNNGSATVTIQGGTSPYTYSWNTNPVQTTATASGLSAGIYTVAITDVNNCSATATVTITEPALLTASMDAPVNISCNGGNNGSATVTIQGGTSPYTYSWNTIPVQTNATASNLKTGNYTVTVTDANSCLATATVTISEPALLTASMDAPIHIRCNGGNNGSATVTVQGGTSPYIYSWNTTPVQNNATATNLIAGNYTVIVTDANNCSATATVAISEPALLTASMNAPVNVSCNGGNNGSATVIAQGGTSPYTYSWNTTSVQTNDIATNLIAGNYTVNVTDANSCSATATVTISEPALLTASISETNNVSCFGGNNGKATVHADGGISPYIYSWNTTPVQTTVTASNLIAGNYKVNVTDANSCSVAATVTISEPPLLVASIGKSVSVNCNGGSDGSLTVNVSGGTYPYNYVWTSNTYPDSATDNNLSAGSYSVTITDAKGCIVIASATVTEPSELSSSLVITSNYSGYSVSCNGSQDGSITVNPTGGTAPYTYFWSNGETTQSISNLNAGCYAVMVTDSHDCQIPGSITLSQPQALSLTSVVEDVLCNGFATGMINLVVNGGVEPYNYNWSNGSTLQNLSGLIAGTYSVAVTDNNGCIQTYSVPITEQHPVIAKYSAINLSCNNSDNGAISLSVSGGTPPYVYNWSNGSTTQNISGLPAGTYIVIISDSNKCLRKDTIIITEPDILYAILNSPFTATGYNIAFYNGTDGSITAIASGGTQPYQFIWSNGDTTQNLSGLSAGVYTLTVTDINGCKYSNDITLTEPWQLQMPTGFSPNGDGLNDYFVIHGIEAYPDNNIVVFNRWGDEVYSKNNYINTWSGNSNSGEALPDGTYYVILTINNTNIKLLGYVDLRRK